MKFKRYMKNVTGVYMVFTDEDKTINIRLTNIDWIKDYLLKTKDGNHHILDEKIEEIQQVDTPNGFKWIKELYDSGESLHDPRKFLGRTIDLYKLIPIINKTEILLSNPEYLLNKLKKTCEL